MIRVATILILLLVAASAQELPTAASCTEPGRSLERPLQLALAGRGDGSGERTLVVLVDPSQGLQQAGFADAFAAAVEMHRSRLARTAIGLAVAGREQPILAEPTTDHRRIVDQVRTGLAGGGGGFVNLYSALRRAGEVAARGKGQAVVLLVSLENGDLEDDVDDTVKHLQRRHVLVEVLASEATLADSYWVRRPNQQRPRDTELTGGDGAIVDLPWGFVLQREPANELTPSGYAPWGLSRVASATGGRVFLYASDSQTRHECLPFGTCLFCDGEHASPLDRWHSVLLTQLAPLTSSRDEVLRARGSDPVFRAMIKTWADAARAGLVREAPAIKATGTSASSDRARAGRQLGLLQTASFPRNGKRALQAARDAERLRDRLAAQLEHFGSDGSPRSVASARYLVALLQLTRVNLMIYAAWCRDVAPRWFDDAGDEPLLPEVAPFDLERRPSGVGYAMLSLCHGVRPFFDVELPGGDEVQQELKVLDGLFSSYLLRYGKSPFGYALRKNGIASFHPVYPGIHKGPVRRRPKSKQDAEAPITPRRPARRGGGSGPAGGPTTGGGR